MGNIIVVGESGESLLFNVSTNQITPRLNITRLDCINSEETIFGVSQSDNGTNETLQLFSVVTGEMLVELHLSVPLEQNAIVDQEFSADGSYLATINSLGTITIWGIHQE